MEMKWFIILRWFQAGLSVYCLLWLRKPCVTKQCPKHSLCPCASVWVAVGSCSPLPVPSSGCAMCCSMFLQQSGHGQRCTSATGWRV